MSTHEGKEKRSVFRVRVAGALLDAEIDGIPGCSLIDANSEGFAIITDLGFIVGEVLPVTLRFDGQEYHGRASVRNMVQIEKGRYRYGFQTVPGDQQLRRGLRAIAISVQREQLRRQAERRPV